MTMSSSLAAASTALAASLKEFQSVAVFQDPAGTGFSPTWSSPGGIEFPRENLPHKPLPRKSLADYERRDPPIPVSHRRTVDQLVS